MPELEGFDSRMSDNHAGRMLISGANGFIGCHLATAASKQGAKVFGLDLPGTNAGGCRVRASLGDGQCSVREVESLDADVISKAVEEFEPDTVVHLAGSTSRLTTVEAWAECLTSNTMLTSEVIRGLMQSSHSPPPVLITAGSQMEYGIAPMPWTEDRVCEPVNPYGVSKVAATELVRMATRIKSLKCCAVRFALVFGPAQPPNMIVPELICKGLTGQELAITHGRQTRRLAYAEDIARFIIHLSTLLRSDVEVPSVINAPACAPQTILELARFIARGVGREDDLSVGAVPPRKDERLDAYPDTSLAESLELVDVTSLETALRETIAWYDQNRWYIDSLLP